MRTVMSAISINEDPAGCVVCHGGTPTVTDKQEAHSGASEALTEVGGPQMFYPDPGSLMDRGPDLRSVP